MLLFIIIIFFYYTSILKIIVKRLLSYVPIEIQLSGYLSGQGGSYNGVC